MVDGRIHPDFESADAFQEIFVVGDGLERTRTVTGAEQGKLDGQAAELTNRQK